MDQLITADILELPSFDGAPADPIHVDVVSDADNGILGKYRHAIAYTCMPSHREAPCVAYSLNGIDWEIPNAAPHPLVTRYADITITTDGADETPSVLGDTDLIWDAATGTLRLFFIASWEPNGGGNAVFLMTTTDGVTWAAPVQVFRHTHQANGSAASPAVVPDGGGSLRMFYMLFNVAANQYRLATRTSADNGVTWTDPVDGVIPLPESGDPIPWHLDALKIGDDYHAVILYSYQAAQEPQGNTGTLYYCTSTDGENFKPGYLPHSLFRNADRLPGSPAIPWPNREHAQSNYRPGLVESLDGSGDFDLYAPSFVGYDKDAETFAMIQLLRHRSLRKLDGTEPRIVVPAATGSTVRHLSARRPVVLDQDYEMTVVDPTDYADLASRSANPWGRHDFTVPMQPGETIRLYAFLQVKNTEDEDDGAIVDNDNYRVTCRPHGAASSAGYVRITVTAVGATVGAVTPKTWTMPAPEEAIGLRTAADGGGRHIIEVDALLTNPSGTATYAGVRVTPQETVATHGRVTILKGSELHVARTAYYATDPGDTPV